MCEKLVRKPLIDNLSADAVVTDDLMLQKEQNRNQQLLLDHMSDYYLVALMHYLTFEKYSTQVRLEKTTQFVSF